MKILSLQTNHCYFGCVHRVMNIGEITRGLMGKEPVLMWPYLCQFVTQFTDLAHLEVFHDALSGYGIQNQNF